MPRAYLLASPLERLHAYTDTSGPLIVPHLGNCHVWTLSCNHSGYGMIRINRKTQLTHRVSWELQIGSIPEDTPCVLHKCDNPPCVRLTHLFIGTRNDNVKDMINKGRERHRSNYGELHHNCKYTDEQVIAIRAASAAGKSQRAVAALFGCSQTYVRSILQGTIRSHN